MTVCALPNRDLEMTAVLQPACRASIAARADHYDVVGEPLDVSHVRRAPSCLSLRKSSLKEPWVADGTAGHQPYVEVGEQHPEQRHPGELHVPGVQPGDLGPHPVPDRMLGEVLEPTSGDVPASVAGQ